MNSTGKVGQELVRELHGANAAYRAATKSLERARSLWDFPASTVYFNYDQQETFAPVLEGVTRLFLLHPEDAPGRHHQIAAFLYAAIHAGVNQIVYMSALGADLRPEEPLCKVEQAVARSGAAYSILRPNWFMQNFNTQDLRRINTRNELLLPSGEARISLIDTRDIAAVAAVLLLDSAHAAPGSAFTLTGGEALTYGEVAARLSAVAGRTITHISPAPESELERLRQRNIPPEHLYFMEWLFEDVRRGYAAQVTGDVQTILQRPPRSFDAYLRDYAQAWQLAPQA
jgi:uncharacterized protein YbjT (DUF2867 family)